jgi:hypothetical protein
MTIIAFLNLERRAGIEPANTGFADLRVDRFATGAFGTVNSGQQRPIAINYSLKIKNPPRLLAGGLSGFEIPASKSSPKNTPAQRSLDSSTYTSRE